MTMRAASSHIPPKPNLPTLDPQYEIQAYLGSGATSHVWRGHDTEGDAPVAVKVMKAGEDPGPFSLECQMLERWAAVEAAAGDSLQMIPRLHASQLKTRTPYLVTDYVRGRKVSDMLWDSDLIDEKLALTIGWQFYRVLHLLHLELQRSYTDMKLDNIWWDSEAGHIWVTDWNVLSEEGRVDALADLDRFASYLYRMATGISLEGRQGFTPRRLARWGGEGWQGLSYGTQSFLEKALARNNAVHRRYPTADASRKELQTLADAWDVSWQQLLAEGKRALDQDQPERAMCWLSIARIKGASTEPYERQATEKILQQKGHTMVRTWLEGQGMRQALETAQDAVEAGKDPLTAQRWLQVARTAKSLGPTAFKSIQTELFTAVNELEEGKFRPAVERLQTSLGSYLNAVDPLKLLAIEAALRIQMGKGALAEADDDLVGAHKCYKEGVSFLEDAGKLDGGKDYVEAVLQDEEIPSPYFEASRVAHLAESRERADARWRLATQAFRDKGPDLAVEELRRGLALDAEYPPLTDLALHWAAIYLARVEYDSACKVLRAALLYVRDHLGLGHLHRLANDCLSIESYCREGQVTVAQSLLTELLDQRRWEIPGGVKTDESRQYGPDLATRLLPRLVARVYDALAADPDLDGAMAWQLHLQAREFAQGQQALANQLDAAWQRRAVALEGGWREALLQIENTIERIKRQRTLASLKRMRKQYTDGIQEIPAYRTDKRAEWEANHQRIASEISRALGVLNSHKAAVGQLDWTAVGQAWADWADCGLIGDDTPGDVVKRFLSDEIEALQNACKRSELDAEVLLAWLNATEGRIRNAYAGRAQDELLSRTARLRRSVVDRPLVRRWLERAEICWQETANLTQEGAQAIARKALLVDAWAWIEAARRLDPDEPRLQALGSQIEGELDAGALASLQTLASLVELQATRGSLDQATELLDQLRQVSLFGDQARARAKRIGDDLEAMLEQRRTEREERVAKVKRDLMRGPTPAEEATLQQARVLFAEGVDDLRLLELYLARSPQSDGGDGQTSIPDMLLRAIGFR